MIKQKDTYNVTNNIVDDKNSKECSLRMAKDFFDSKTLSDNDMITFFKQNKQLMREVFEQEVLNKENVNLIKNSYGVPKANFISNFKEIFKNDLKFKDRISFNSFDSEIYIMNDNNTLEFFSDKYISDAKLYIENKYDLSCSNKDAFFQGLKSCAMEKEYNPLKDLITEEEWDGTERIKTLFSDYLGAKDCEYTQMVSTKFMVGAVSRILNPGCKFDLMPILYGDQGIGKSYFVRKLSSDYVIEDLNRLSSQDKDEIIKLKNGWIAEIAELTALKNVNKENAKSFITQQENKYRELYSNSICFYKRHNVFIGTTNTIDFLNDDSGNRRFLPIECGVNNPLKPLFSDTDNGLSANVSQIYAEAVFKYKHGETCYLSQEQESLANSVREENEKDSPMSEYIESYLSCKYPRAWENYTINMKKEFIENKDNYASDDLVNLTQVSTQELLNLSIPKFYSDIHNIDARKIKMTMNKIRGWKRSSNIKENGKRTRGYKRITL
ncbi:virulence-associated E family protein [Apilactobacillus kunkeei]|uniref:virulence-associated E family protein n=1 Tax=Apilactobacillus kunkeei TaxID=148814 RepID=UPI002DDDBB22